MRGARTAGAAKRPGLPSVYTTTCALTIASIHLFFTQRLAHYLDDKDAEEIALPQEPTRAQRVQLTQQQQQVVDAIDGACATNTFQPIVLHGVTGSGKTEIYKDRVGKTLAAGKNVLLLFPEVSLAVRFTHIFKQACAHQAPVFGFHSATSKPEKRQLWAHLYSGKPAIIIGVHLPLLLPIPNLGIIIMDEEHDVGYQEKKIPRIHTKEAALMRAQLLKIPIILGSATPSLHSLHSVEHKGWKLLQLHERFKGQFPEIRVVQLIEKISIRSG